MFSNLKLFFYPHPGGFLYGIVYYHTASDFWPADFWQLDSGIYRGTYSGDPGDFFFSDSVSVTDYGAGADVLLYLDVQISAEP